LAAFFEFRFGLGSLVQAVLFDLAKAGHGGEHGFAVLGELLAMHINFRLNNRHSVIPRP
jgi:hypothetical protein